MTIYTEHMTQKAGVDGKMFRVVKTLAAFYPIENVQNSLTEIVVDDIPYQLKVADMYSNKNVPGDRNANYVFR